MRFFGMVTCAQKHADGDRRQAEQRDQCGHRQSQDKGSVAELGNMVLPTSPADFEKLVAEETKKWGKVIRAANIKAD